MYLFVFFWTPALKAAAAAQSPRGSPELPLGMIFATFMASVMLGSLLFKSETMTFWSFCVFEMCVGMYWPSVGYLKGRIVEDGIRARVYGMLRIPLNVFVVVALGLVKEGEGYRNAVFMTCSGLLVITSGIFHHIVSD
jgi:MFS transporter, MFS domain-containing protein family, molybdate-anion transporter